MKTRILVVDDELDFTTMLKLCLEASGPYEVRQENNAACAQTAAQQFLPDLVLMDVLMPEMSGLDVAENMHNDPVLKDTPVIFLSAAVRRNAPPPQFPLSLTGHCTFLPKPITIDALLENIQKVLDAKALDAIAV